MVKNRLREIEDSPGSVIDFNLLSDAGKVLYLTPQLQEDRFCVDMQKKLKYCLRLGLLWAGSGPQSCDSVR